MWKFSLFRFWCRLPDASVNSTACSPLQSERRRRQTLLNQFRGSMDALMTRLRAREAHFVRCVKPNEEMIPGSLDRELCARQLRYLGVRDTVRIRQAGYAIRYRIDEFCSRYRGLLPKSGEKKRKRKRNVIGKKGRGVEEEEREENGWKKRKKIFLKFLSFQNTEIIKQNSPLTPGAVLYTTPRSHGPGTEAKAPIDCPVPQEAFPGNQRCTGTFAEAAFTFLTCLQVQNDRREGCFEKMGERGREGEEKESLARRNIGLFVWHRHMSNFPIVGRQELRPSRTFCPRSDRL